jgi:hypothetical protein
MFTATSNGLSFIQARLIGKPYDEKAMHMAAAHSM